MPKTIVFYNDLIRGILLSNAKIHKNAFTYFKSIFSDYNICSRQSDFATKTSCDVIFNSEAKPDQILEKELQQTWKWENDLYPATFNCQDYLWINLT